jgi:hypothetical protein
MIESNLSKKEAINLLLKEVLYNSFSQAILKLLQTPHVILKVILFLFVLITFGITSYLVIESIMDYFSYEVSTTSRSFYENSTPFPKVIFCNVNQFATKYAYSLTQANISDGNGLTDSLKKKLGHNLDDILVECWFNAKQCDLNDFVWSFDAKYGNCYAFYANNRSIMPGFEFGLQLTIYVNIYERLLNLTTLKSPPPPILGAVFRIENSSYLSYTAPNDILISPGFQTNIVVKREFNSILPKPYSDCEYDSNSPKYRHGMDLYNLILNSKYQYTQSFCFMQCLQRVIIGKYNCSLKFWVSLFNASTCSMDIQIALVYTDTTTLNEEFFEKNCLSQCPLECDQASLKTSITFNQLNGYAYVEKIRNNSNLSMDFVNRPINANSARESIAYVNVFYSSLSYASTTETSKINFVSLLASMGGNLGLFLGVSVFSLCEIVEVVVEIYFILKTNRLEVSQSTSTTRN